MLNNSKLVQDRAIVTMADQYKITYGLLNGTIFSDLEQPLIQFSRSHHSLTRISHIWLKIRP